MWFRNSPTALTSTAPPAASLSPSPLYQGRAISTTPTTRREAAPAPEW
uniref:Uncharacterized protein n=1 Tax=Arundo donax TaxID=35708 RepID=A0A0A9FLP1_ARUDO